AQVQLPCRTDVQVETPLGAFALTEWLRDKRVMLKTSTGPVLTRDPWLPSEEA
ncbi:phosphoribosyl-dephospho-CoA transferase MdcG domain-containing protein, partial [Hafnia alvei]